MRILHVTDTHLGIERFYRGGPPGWRRAHDHRDLLTKVLAPAMEGAYDLVILSGDVFDRSSPPPEAVDEAVALLGAAARAVPVVAIPGNHDRTGIVRHLGAAAGVILCDEPEQVRVGDLRVACVPWYRESADWASAAAKAVGEGADLLVAHQSFDGSRVPGFVFRARSSAETVAASQIPPGVPLVLSGHVHTRQAFPLGHTTVVHAGAMERTAAVEADEVKGVVEVHFGATPTWRFVDVPARPMRVVSEPDPPAELVEGALVHLRGSACTVETERAIVQRGGRVSPWSRPSRQARLFA